MKITKSWLESRIITSRVIASIDDETECRRIAKQRGILLDEKAIEYEVRLRKSAREARSI